MDLKETEKGRGRWKKGLDKTYLNPQRRIRLQRLPIIHIQRSARRTIRTQRNQQPPRIPPRRRSRKCRFLDWQDARAAHIHGDMPQRRIDGDVLARSSSDRRLVVPVVPYLAASHTRKNAVHSHSALCQNGRDHKGGTKQELSVCRGEGGVVWEFPGEGAHDGAACCVGEVECRVDVREEGVAYCGSYFGGFDYACPNVGLLADGGPDIVIAVEGEESGELHPAVAKLGVAVPTKATCVNAEHGNAEEGG
jgi:hypothetical protein